MVPWIVDNPGVSVAEIADRFGIGEADVIADLDVVWMVGLPPYTPDALIEVLIEDDRVWINYADYFARPLRLTAAQALAMLTAADALRSLPGTEPDGALSRALSKLAGAMGIDPDAAVDVDLGEAPGDILTTINAALTQGHDLEIDYYSFGRDRRTTRRVTPRRVASAQGSWYVDAYCHHAAEPRLFRVDRIERVRALGPSDTNDLRSASDSEADRSLELFAPASQHALVTLALTPEMAWVAEAYPTVNVKRRAKGALTVTLVANQRPWLERLLLRLGANAAMVAVDGPADIATMDMAAAAAARVLERYGPSEPPKEGAPH